MKKIALALCLLLSLTLVFGQSGQRSYKLEDTTGLTPLGVLLAPSNHDGKKAVRLLDTAQGITAGTKLAVLSEVTFHNGTIEVEVAGGTRRGASATARGFIGIAFRINQEASQYECIYLRPGNGRADDQVRRNHSVQYISHPEHPWERLRKEEPEKYETYVDLEMGAWTKVKIDVQDGTARLYVHGAVQPTLVVSDLKLGKEHRGSVGLWIGPETEGYFRNLVVTPKD